MSYAITIAQRQASLVGTGFAIVSRCCPVAAGDHIPFLVDQLAKRTTWAIDYQGSARWIPTSPSTVSRMMSARPTRSSLPLEGAKKGRGFIAREGRFRVTLPAQVGHGQ
jgi:hypothetical protein